MEHYTVTLYPTGRRPVVFEGERIAESKSYRIGEDTKRGHALDLFKTSSGKFVVSIKYQTTVFEESLNQRVDILNTIEEIEEALVEYDPVQYAISIEWDGTPHKARRDLVSGWNRAISGLLKDFPLKIE